MQRAKFLFYFPERGKGLGVEMRTSIKRVRALSFLLVYNWIVKGQGGCYCVAPGLFGCCNTGGFGWFSINCSLLHCYLLPVTVGGG